MKFKRFKRIDNRDYSLGLCRVLSWKFVCVGDWDAISTAILLNYSRIISCLLIGASQLLS